MNSDRAPDRAPVVTIFTKPECGLCEEAEEVIEAVRVRPDVRPFHLVRRNILQNFADYDRYKHDIPVILVNGVEIARHHVSEQVLASALSVPTESRLSDRRRPPSPLAGEGGGEGGARGVGDAASAESCSDDLRKGPSSLHTLPPHPDPLPSGEKGPEADIAVVIMAKYPTPGRVKTRLVPPLSAEQAARLHEEFLLHLVRRLRSRRIIVCFDPPDREADMRRLVDVELMPQSSGDLGQRLADAASACGARYAIFLGVDSPDVPITYIDRVGELLATHDLVIAPADDGGYWAVALTPRVDAAELFAGIEWSTGREGAQTLERARALGYNVAVADRWADVDRPEDLRRLIERLRASSSPADRQLLARLSFLPDGVV